jgi:hypothetical protein
LNIRPRISHAPFPGRRLPREPHFPFEVAYKAVITPLLCKVDTDETDLIYPPSTTTMTLKRKAASKSGNPSPSKRQKLDSDSKYSCQLCTSTVSEDVVTIKYKVTKGKQHDTLTAHQKCVDIIPELDCAKGNDSAKICAANLPSYKTRFKLVRVRIHSTSMRS